MRLIFGLGNPGFEYERTRHNAGFIILDGYANEKGLSWGHEGKFKATMAKGDDFWLVKPLDNMNNSGSVVRTVADFYKVTGNDIYIFHDDVDLEFGRIKRQLGGGTAGHHGVIDIVEKLGTPDFWRVRIGVGRPLANKFDVMDWVLKDFTEEELNFVRSVKVGELV